MAKVELNDRTLELMAAIPAKVGEGRQIFEQFCVACHGAGGEGSVGPNLTDPFWIHGWTPMQIHKTVTYGVPDKGMVAWAGQLGPARVQTVTAYVLTLKNTNRPGKAPQGEPEAAPRRALRRPPQPGGCRGASGDVGGRRPDGAAEGVGPTSRRRSSSTPTARATPPPRGRRGLSSTGTSSRALIIPGASGSASGATGNRHPAAAGVLFGLALTSEDFWLLFFVLSGAGFALIVATSLLGRVWCGPPARDGVPRGRVPPDQAARRGRAFRVRQPRA
jgi:mono/diheme cytochrome c family protein